MTDPDDAETLPPNAARRKLPKPTHLQSDEEREEEDIKVARFYFDSGNNIGAYRRLKDAVTLAQDDPEAFYLLGGTALRLGKPEESAEAYTQFLKLEPDSRRAKSLRRSIAPREPAK